MSVHRHRAIHEPHQHFQHLPQSRLREPIKNTEFQAVVGEFVEIDVVPNGAELFVGCGAVRVHLQPPGGRLGHFVHGGGEKLAPRHQARIVGPHTHVATRRETLGAGGRRALTAV